MNVKRLGVVFFVVVVLAAAGFGAAKLLVGDSGTEAQQHSQQVDVAAIQQALEAEKQKPRFKGELLGIFIARSETDWPEEYQRENQRLIAGGCSPAAIEDAKQLDFPRGLALPQGYALTPGYPQAVACGGTVTGINWEFTGTASNGAPATVLVARSISKAWGVDAAADRVSTEAIGNSEAIVVRPITTDGTGQASQVLFREPFGLTAMHAFNVSEADLLALAGAVSHARQ